MENATTSKNQQPGIHMLAKPIGPICNFDCQYCYYTEKKALYQNEQDFRMSDKVLEAFIRKYIAAQTGTKVEFVWHGGEPTLLSLDFFRKAIELQKSYADGKTIENSLQTNGSLLTDAWCKFLKQHNFLVGISLDGPREIHDRYRVNKKGKATFNETMNGLRLLQKHKVDFNILACVAKETAKHPLEVYEFFKQTGAQYIQFTPIIERIPTEAEQKCGLHLASPAALEQKETNTTVTSWTVEPEAYGDFLITIFDEWIRHDVGSTFVMNFEWALNAWIGRPSPMCQFAKQCGSAIALEHNGDVYACDHCVYPQYKLGNILNDDPIAMVEQSLTTGFGINKTKALPKCCHECKALAACYGGCPGYRFQTTCSGEPGLHYLCAGYKKFFKYIRKYLKTMAELLANGLPASCIMESVDTPLVIKRIDR